MAGKVQIDWPRDEELVRLIERTGSQAAAALVLNVSSAGLKNRVDRQGLRHRVTQILKDAPKLKRAPADAAEQKSGIIQAAGTVTVVMPAGQNPELGDYAQLLRDRGLDPDEWTVISLKANTWNAMTSDKATGDNRIVDMHQHTITLRPALHKLLVMPAVHVPPVKRTRVGPPAADKPQYIIVEGDHQVPYHDPQLHEASIRMLKWFSRRKQFVEHDFLGDTGDFPTISRHNDHPNATATPNQVVQGMYDVLREKREAAPNAQARKLKGNHDWRIEAEQLARVERMYGLRPAQEWEAEVPELPALHLDRLLHLPKLGIELVEDPRGWEHAEIELVPGPRGLVVRHGWLHGAKTAEASVKKRGRSIIVGHIHRREHVFVWDPSMGCERVGVVAGTMSLCRDERFPSYTTLDNWLQGCVVVTRWPDGDFAVEHARWNGKALRWRDETW